jgi:uncharacterized protein (TIGR03086 family)
MLQWQLAAMDQLEGHRRAHTAFAEVLAAVTSDQLGAPSPCTGWDAAAVIDHVIDGNVRVVARAGGDGPPLSGDRIADHAHTAEAAHGVFAAPDGLTRMFELPIGSVSGSVFVTLRTVDALVHAWDLARATNQPTDLDAQLAEAYLERSSQLISPALRGPGRPFGEEQPCPDPATAADRLAAFLGRSVA